MRMDRGVEAELHAFSTSALYAGVRSTSRPSHVYLREKNAGIHCTGGWVGAIMYRRNVYLRESNTGRQARGLVTILTGLSGLHIKVRITSYWQSEETIYT
jgi:hypothetical protein